jgi:hypothetical protein
MYRTLDTQRPWSEWLTRRLYCWLQGTNFWPFIYSVAIFCRFPYKRGLVYGMCWFGCTRWTRFLYWWISLRGQSWCRRSLTFWMSGNHIPKALMLRVFGRVRNIAFEEGIGNKAVSIWYNSRATLLALKPCAVSPRVVLQCRDSLQELPLSNRVRLVWVPGHCGVHGNETDALARAGSSSAFVEPEPCLLLAPSSV